MQGKVRTVNPRKWDEMVEVCAICSIYTLQCTWFAFCSAMHLKKQGSQTIHPMQKLVPGKTWYLRSSSCSSFINGEGFLAEVFHPWVRWEGPGSGLESTSAGAVWKSVIFQNPVFVFAGI